LVEGAISHLGPLVVSMGSTPGGPPRTNTWWRYWSPVPGWV